MAACVDVFVYGTLMDENFLYSLTRCRFLRSEAELAGFERVSPSNGYPYIVPNPNRVVGGLVLFNVDASSLAIFDDYEEEGVLYHRRSLEVMVGERRLPCEVYVGDVAALTRHFPTPTSSPALLNS